MSEQEIEIAVLGYGELDVKPMKLDDPLLLKDGSHGYSIDLGRYDIDAILYIKVGADPQQPG